VTGNHVADNANSPARVFRTALIVGAVIVLALLVWQLADVLLLGFAAILFAIILRSLAAPIEKHTPVRLPWSLVISGLVVAAVAALFVFLLGAQIHDQVTGLVDRLPEILSSLGDRLGMGNLDEQMVEQVTDFSTRNGLVGKIAGLTSTLIGGLANSVLVVAAGVYLAIHPARYRDGLLKLVPKGRRAEAASAVDNAGQALRLWLLGQLISMTIVGVLVTAGLYAIGMPSALALGFLAGVSEFVPLVGPVLSAVPAILLALSEGGAMVYWVSGLYIAVQQIEGSVIMPLVQRQTVDLPPVLTLFAILSLGILFGPLGVLLGTPLTVVMYVAVKQLYVRDTLGEPVSVPGERNDGGG
jgi:predicted PurR-regulated permease PerM